MTVELGTLGGVIKTAYEGEANTHAYTTADRDKVANVPADTTTALAGKSDTTHNHDLDYAAIGHDHAGVYAPDGHNHDLAYAAIGHNHDADYAAAGHNHDLDYTAAAHATDTTNPHSVTAAQVGAAEAVHNHDADYAPAAHATDTTNPHSVTAAQLGLDVQVDVHTTGSPTLLFGAVNVLKGAVTPTLPAITGKHRILVANKHSATITISASGADTIVAPDGTSAATVDIAAGDSLGFFVETGTAWEAV